MSNPVTARYYDRRPRILKSNQMADVAFPVPLINQLTAADLRTAPITVSAPALVDAGVDPRLQEAEEAEARARAMERRAGSFLMEAEEAVAARLRATQEQAAVILEAANRTADQVKAEAEETGRQAGWDAGYQAGLAAAMTEAGHLADQGRVEAAGLIDEARRVADGIAAQAVEQRDALIEAAKDQVLDLAFHMAEQILKAELTLHPSALVPMVEAAIAKLKGEADLAVCVSTTALDTLEAERSRLVAAQKAVKRLTIQADEGLETGDFVITGAQGRVDGRINRQVERMERHLRAGGA